MPVTSHQLFLQPADASQRIWRYMDFIKLYSLLHGNTLYFPSAELLSKTDPFEGSLSKLSATQIKVTEVCRSLVNLSNIEEKKYTVNKEDLDLPENLQYSFRKQSETAQHMRKHVYINSWHMNDAESAAMWKLYTAYGYGVAITSTYNRLKKSLENAQDDIFLGTVQYIDHECSQIDMIGNLLEPFLYKTQSYKHESELRALVADQDGIQHAMALVWDPPEHHPQEKNFPTGLRVECDLSLLIEHVIVSPRTPDWIYYLVNDLCVSTVGKEAHRSKLDESPFF